MLISEDITGFTLDYMPQNNFLQGNDDGYHDKIKGYNFNTKNGVIAT